MRYISLSKGKKPNIFEGSRDETNMIRGRKVRIVED